MDFCNLLENQNQTCLNTAMPEDTTNTQKRQCSGENTAQSSQQNSLAPLKPPENGSEDRKAKKRLKLQITKPLLIEIPESKGQKGLTEEEFEKLRDTLLRELWGLKANVPQRKSTNGECSASGSKESDEPNETIVESGNTKLVIARKITAKAQLKCHLCETFYERVTIPSEYNIVRNQIWSEINNSLDQLSPARGSDNLLKDVCYTCVGALCIKLLRYALPINDKLRQFFQKKTFVKYLPKASQIQGKKITQIQPSVDNVVSLLKESTKKRQCPKPTAGRSKSAPANQKQETEKAPSTTTSRQKQETEKAPRTTSRPKQSKGRKRKASTNNLCNKKRAKAASIAGNKGKKEKMKAAQKQTAYIDLTQLDPEYNEGIEAEWLLDLDTIHSCMVVTNSDQKKPPSTSSSSRSVETKAKRSKAKGK